MPRNPNLEVLDELDSKMQKTHGIHVHADGPGVIRIFKNGDVPDGASALNAEIALSAMGYDKNLEVKRYHVTAYGLSKTGMEIRVLYGRTYEPSTSLQVAMQTSLPARRVDAERELEVRVQEFLEVWDEVCSALSTKAK